MSTIKHTILKTSMSSKFKWMISFGIILIFAITAVKLNANDKREYSLPLRSKTVKVGDWILYKTKNGFIKDTAVEVNNTSDNIIIKYKVECFTPDMVRTSIKNILMSLKYEQARNKMTIESAKSQSVPILSELMDLNGKTIRVFYVKLPAGIDKYYSNEASVSGLIKIIFSESSGLDDNNIEAVDFGNSLNSYQL